MSGRFFTDSEGVVLTLDFTDVAAIARTRIDSHRQTTSSRRPGRVIAGTVHREPEQRRIELCPDCGNTRWSDDVPHAVRVNNTSTGHVDCIGREVRR